MSIVKVTLPGGQIPVNGKQVSFVAPCDCTNVEGLSIEGEVYTVVDAMGNCVTGIGGAFCAGAVVSVVLDVSSKKAYIQNPASPMNLHWWKRSALTENYTATTAEFAKAGSTHEEKYYYSDTVSISADGTVTLDNPQTVWFGNSSSNSGKSNINTLIGKYFGKDTSSSAGKIFYDKDGTITASFNNDGTFYWLEIRNIFSVTASLGEWELVSSSNPTEYPMGELNGVEYVYLGVPFENARDGGVKIVTGSYVGTGTYGKDKPCSLTFEFAPKIVFMLGYDFNSNGRPSVYFGCGKDNLNGYMYVMSADLLKTSYMTALGFSNGAECYGKKSEDGKTFSWYNVSDASYQCNYANSVYYYMAIG